MGGGPTVGWFLDVAAVLRAGGDVSAALDVRHTREEAAPKDQR